MEEFSSICVTDKDLDLSSDSLDVADLLKTYQTVYNEKLLAERKLKSVIEEVDKYKAETSVIKSQLASMIDINRSLQNKNDKLMYFTKKSEKIESIIQQLEVNVSTLAEQHIVDLDKMKSLNRNAEKMQEQDTWHKEKIKLLEENIEYFLAENTRLVQECKEMGLVIDKLTDDVKKMTEVRLLQEDKINELEDKHIKLETVIKQNNIELEDLSEELDTKEEKIKLLNENVNFTGTKR